MIERIRYGGVSNPYNYSEFTCDTAADIADLPTNKDVGKYKNLDTCSVGSKATVISDRTMYILNGDNQWVLLKDYKATGGGSSILIDETLTESGQAADAKAVGDKIAEVDAKIDTTPWGDFIPGWDSDTSAMYCTAKLVSVLGKHSWQVLPSISTVKHNAIEMSMDGLFALDLKPDVNELKESAHTHSNKDILDEITSDKITAWDGYSTEIQTVKDGLVGKKDSSSEDSTGEIFNSYESFYKNKASGEYSHAEGCVTKASGIRSHAEGSVTTASGNASHAEGSSTKATENASHSEGCWTEATGKYSHAEGSYTKASEDSSHSEGYYAEASGKYSHAEGSRAKAIGESSHAEGNQTEASGEYSHAEGSVTKASENASHAEGAYTEASSWQSHAEGYGTKATAPYSHAEGKHTIASGFHSHAEGEHTIASGGGTHAEGSYTKASGSYQHVQGKYNIEDIYNKYAFIIGNGTSDTARSNAFSVDWNGKIYVNNATEGVDVSALAATIAELQSSVGDISTILSTMVEV
ncbi:MAG TPA: hypothetical protein DCW90_23580 [Lachnospiraceae bacterium]|nr:hypothetical protein [Lachnospiraceae bacterium]